MPQEYPIILRGFLGTVSRIHDVAYGATGGDVLHADLYLPVEAPRPLPVIVFLNDGTGTPGRKTGPDLGRFFTQRGLAMASVEYRDAEDVKAAIHWVRSSAEQYGFDPARIGVWGVAKGAQVALEIDDPALKAVAAAYPLSPHALRGTQPPVLLIHGLTDRVVSAAQSQALFDALGAAGNNVTLCVIDGLGHGFMNRDDFDQTEFRRVMKYECRDGEPPVITEAPPFTFGTVETFFRRWL